MGTIIWMIGVAIFVGVVIFLLVRSRNEVNKGVKKAFELAEKDDPYPLLLSLKLVMGYCDRNNIVYEYVRNPGFIIVEYGDKNVIVQQDGHFILGYTYFTSTK